MKANEFVKKYGLELSREIVSNQPKWASNVRVSEITGTWEYTEKVLPSFSIVELERLVEAHEIIKLFKSLDHAKAEAQACEHSKHSEILVKLDVGVGYIWLSRVKQAIADVESCMGEG